MKDLGNKKVMANNIRRYMDLQTVSAKDMSRALGIPYTTILSWIKADNYPRIDKIEAMADYFGILKSDLIEEPPEEQPESPYNIYLDADEYDIIGKYKGLSPGQKKAVRQMIEAFMWE